MGRSYSMRGWLRGRFSRSDPASAGESLKNASEDA